jgi:cytochrome P450
MKRGIASPAVVHDASLWWDATDLRIERVREYAAAREQLAAPRLSVEALSAGRDREAAGGQAANMEASLQRLVARGWANRWRKSFVYQPELSDGIKRAVRRHPLSRPSSETCAFFADVTQQILETFQPNTAFDIDVAFSEPFAMRITEALMGMTPPPVTRADVRALNALAKHPELSPEQLIKSIPVLKTFYDHIANIVRTQSYAPNGVLAAFVEVQNDKGFDEEALVMCAIAVTSAALVVADSVTSILKRLYLSRELPGTLRDHPEKVPGIVEELLRLCPSADILTVLTLDPDGCPMATKIHVKDANCDPAVFENPLDVRLDRPKHRHLSFGYGQKSCDGMQIVRTSLAVSLPMLVTQLEGLRVTPSDEVGGPTMAIFESHA